MCSTGFIAYSLEGNGSIADQHIRTHSIQNRLRARFQLFGFITRQSVNAQSHPSNRIHTDAQRQLFAITTYTLLAHCFGVSN